jgi:Lrp/AsnC family transcriptional regulator for asnA, asnC and gidA
MAKASADRQVAGGPATALGHGSHALLDEVARSIVRELQQDGRRTYAMIGEAVGLSEAAVRARVQRLRADGVMQIVAVTDPVQLGFARLAMIGVRTTGDLERVAEELAAFEDIDYLVLTAGSFDLLAEVICRDDDHLLDLVQRIRAVTGVRSTEAFVYLKLCKETYNWGAR